VENDYYETIYTRGREPVCYHGLHKLWIIAGGPQIILNFILKFYLYLIMKDGVKSIVLCNVFIEASYDILSKYPYCGYSL